ncbi:hypothetical protein LAZ67_23000101 [Cordylochernes scorpioides]|uniref:CCHC-type domain-containing protein n=1 Tax=Cordylochernes scorpioides TaxID=51811 RepID=A0ABY6LPP7_9ARAC|nr:hypothetical protein LAZ67_23000101 [Cordylochernes scorpioides]
MYVDVSRRRSRRLRGLSPTELDQESEMSVKSEMEGSQSTRTSFTCLQQPRNPSAFGGKDSECPYQWLSDYDRVSRHNGWDESLCLANVIFYLEGTAKCWFENVEESLNSWPRFKEEFLKIFGDQEHFVRKAESKLKIRAQRIGEPSESYIQDILNLCRQVNPAMGEIEKMAHLMKGVAEDIFQALLPVEMATVDEFSRQCRRIEDRKKKRIGVAYFERLANVASISGDSDLDFENLIRKIIKEEVGKALSCKGPLTCSEQLENEVYQRAENTLAPILKRPNYPTRGYKPWHEVQDARRESKPYTSRKTDEFRTPDNIPICFHCNRPGHVVRYCRERRRQYQEARANESIECNKQGRTYYNPNFFYRPQYSSISETNDDNFGVTNRRTPPRSSSPYPGRGRFGIERRQSQSPSRRSSRSPRPVNREN